MIITIIIIIICIIPIPPSAARRFGKVGSTVVSIEAVASAAAAVAPPVTIALELAIGLLLAIDQPSQLRGGTSACRQLGIGLAMLLHLGIVLTPPPVCGG